ncbi:MAG: DUF3696 domain-containing protein [Anaerolineae bacterium]|nr:DUF3696 domain-containing protein [Anaerolineae bacterium]MCX8068368.1 DUF3696 domain-containing protein [Anaerolineae bacterium]MDW7991200.1 DUF3696 domain-containing protein [Anaerolineae bacterium]
MNNSETRYRLRRIAVEGFKSLRNLASIEFGDLTLLAGANSSGKSSLMQPLLLFKQSLEARYDPGRLLLGGPNVSLGTARETLWKGAETFTVILETKEGLFGELRFRPDQEGYSFLTAENIWGYGDCTLSLRADMAAEIQEAIQGLIRLFKKWLSATLEFGKGVELNVSSYRGFLALAVGGNADWFPFLPWVIFGEIAKGTIHIPALRGNPQRRYPYTVPEKQYFPGLFQDYVAGVITRWQERKSDQLTGLWNDLQHIGLTWKVEARRISDTEVELLAGRLQTESDMVNLADVGFGFSQVLPVLVALRAAQPGQLVYVEQPEIHLHPNAQVKLADLLVQAALRGVQVVVETHSELILLGIQKAVAEGKLEPDAVKLHWFERDEEGVTHVQTAELDEEGTFGDWPVDFSDVALDAMGAYLDAAAQRRSRQQ